MYVVGNEESNRERGDNSGDGKVRRRQRKKRQERNFVKWGRRQERPKRTEATCVTHTVHRSPMLTAMMGASSACHHDLNQLSYDAQGHAGDRMACVQPVGGERRAAYFLAQISALAGALAFPSTPADTASSVCWPAALRGTPTTRIGVLAVSTMPADAASSVCWPAWPAAFLFCFGGVFALSKTALRLPPMPADAASSVCWPAWPAAFLFLGFFFPALSTALRRGPVM